MQTRERQQIAGNQTVSPQLNRSDEATKRRSDEATKDDVYYAYRLLLGREPDEQGWTELCEAIVRHPVTPDELGRGFIESAEFIARCKSDIPRGDSPVEVRMEGFSIFVRLNDRDIGRHIQSTRVYEPHVTAAMRSLLRPADVFVDVGANIGFFTNLAAHLVGPTGKVLAVEPMDKNVQLIFRAVERNGFQHVLVNSCAASDRNGRVCIRTDTGTSNGQALAAGAADQHALFAQTRLLDDLTADLPRIDLVKFDIEGFEMLAWRGFRQMLEKHRPNVLTEFHPYCMREFVGLEPREYLDELFAYSPTIFVLEPRGKPVSCATADDVMRQWQAADQAARADGKYHLDLLVETRH